MAPVQSATGEAIRRQRARALSNIWQYHNKYYDCSAAGGQAGHHLQDKCQLLLMPCLLSFGFFPLLSQRWSCAAPDATVPVLAYRVLSFFF